jgi:hypothetical protein
MSWYVGFCGLTVVELVADCLMATRRGLEDWRDDPDLAADDDAAADATGAHSSLDWEAGDIAGLHFILARATRVKP